MSFYKFLIRPVLFIVDPEKVHHITFFFLRTFNPFLKLFVPKSWKSHHERNILGIKFPHPVGLAAGLDKDGKAYKSLGKLGFSFVELGTVTPLAQAGNLKPRLFRIVKDKALINRMGFNNHGVEELARRLEKRSRSLIIGGNIGKNTKTSNESAAKDYLECFTILYDRVDYFVVNVSCPNIQDLRELQDKDNLMKIVVSLFEYRATQNKKKPVLLKVSPDLNNNQLDDLIQVVKDTGIDGLVATNTTVSRDKLTLKKESVDKIGKGGLSGSPLRSRSTEVIRYLCAKLGPEFPIIASGGVMTAEDAIEKIDAGAQLVQVYTGFIYQGPKLIRDILKRV
ncbi:MAG: quinone-dependent dihydroorotate dehydrogenase [Bacteroidetes bacterium]|jgi:dihydroorotate dehydrogenase|nr:quinone-dependent dihydroorotate dehydrogenase [Bacteroidota bacterium]MBT4410885.1 quinone-dependent dihydroorotate dehydrogenase [Bacteroidota bacterium]MBT7095230.1 quinone-dependent dihydroorotate dehydrogenase [Bacteroidota bacterium]MBT7463359.1 quinone-dependent dihydroorotate dehydrogenase [Bacteroidota bacterium]